MREHHTSTEGMVDYGDNSAMQQRLVDLCHERIADLVRGLGHVTPELRLADYGCGPGPSAIAAVAPAIEAYRAQFPDAPVSVCHADLPGNDWNSLFHLAAGPSGYAASNIRTTAAVGSFYDPMLADHTVDLGTCFMASHWLSESPVMDAPSGIWFGDLESTARAALAAHAREDWLRFLRMRARELRRGGILLVACLGAIDDEREISGVAASGRNVYRAIHRIAQAMVDDGLIEQGVLDRFVFGLWFMTAGEARVPLETDPELRAAFAIEEVSVAPAPYNASDVFADSVDDPAEYARLYTGYIRGFAHSSLNTSLFQPAASERMSAEQLAQDYYRRLEALYRTSPGQHAGETWYLTVVLRRR